MCCDIVIYEILARRDLCVLPLLLLFSRRRVRSCVGFFSRSYWHSGFRTALVSIPKMLMCAHEITWCDDCTAEKPLSHEDWILDEAIFAHSCVCVFACVRAWLYLGALSDAHKSRCMIAPLVTVRPHIRTRIQFTWFRYSFSVSNVKSRIQTSCFNCV